MLNYWWFGVLVLNVLLLRAGRWGRGTRWLELGLSLFGAYILWVIMRSAWMSFRHGALLHQIGDPGLRVVAGWGIVALLALSLVGVLISTVSRLSRLRVQDSLGRIEWAELARKSGKAIEGSSHGDLEQTLRRDLKDVYHFYIDEDSRRRLAGMGPLGKSFYFIVWLAKSMFFKLTPARRVLLIASVAAPTLSFQVEGADFRLDGVGYLILLVILLLELKDKLTARDELEVGRAVQVALLPRQNPQISGWDVWLYTEPANEVGGDLVDYLQINEGRWGVALGDVAGKGLGAALLMAKLQATLRALAPGFDGLGEMGTELNTIIYRDGLRNRFASLIYLELVPDSGDLHVLNAGHLPPVVMAKGKAHEMPRGGPALGLLPRWAYEESVVRLRTGETLLVYSDGLTEAINERGEFFGDRRLQELFSQIDGLSAEGMGKRLLDEVDQFVSGGPRSDDLSLLILKRES
jgi:serine phosphatase RsbU (regulator of sigma subunit)